MQGYTNECGKGATKPFKGDYIVARPETTVVTLPAILELHRPHLGLISSGTLEGITTIR